jgi:hypothetical protein
MRVAIAIAIFAVGCSSAATPGGGEVSDAAASPLPGDGEAPAHDASSGTEAASADASTGPLGAACDPSAASSCPDGLQCFGYHTAKGWGCGSLAGCQGDLYGHCYVTCASGTGGEDSCNALGGLCGCPVIEGNDAGWQCLPGGSMVCIRTTL